MAGIVMQKGKMLTIRLTDELLAKIDTWRATQRPIPTRPEVARIALERLVAEDEPKDD